MGSRGGSHRRQGDCKGAAILLQTLLQTIAKIRFGALAASATTPGYAASVRALRALTEAVERQPCGGPQRARWVPEWLLPHEDSHGRLVVI